MSFVRGSREFHVLFLFPWCRKLVLSTSTFLYCKAGQECIFKYCAVEGVSDIWRVSHLDNVVVVRPTYGFTFSLMVQSTLSKKLFELNRIDYD